MTANQPNKKSFFRAAMTLLFCVLTSATAWAETITLTAETGAVTLQDGDVLTGTGGANTHVSIADGATVTLSGASITAIPNNSSHRWAGITCLGDATIILDEGTTNSVTGGYFSSGIFVPQDKTLTIKGTGTLNATGNWYGAGIGSTTDASCGNITIEGGNINATGGSSAAGIGSGGEDSHCGNITITGGSVTAKGGYGSAGIGSGYGEYFTSICGGITITNGVTKVSASGSKAIGTGDGYSNCGTVTIGGVVTGNISQGSFVTYPYTVSFDANGGTGTMESMDFMYNVAKKLTANQFTKAYHAFDGWATTPDGAKAYDDEQSVKNLTQTSGATVTLYATWTLAPVVLTAETGAMTVGGGQVISGTGGADTRITIADGATVTLSGASITAIPNDNNHWWAGITCEGDATIILSGDNTLTGGYESPGIYVPANKTLTIQGDGSLNATGRYYAAGIGGGYNLNCGNIIIEGGNITATAGYYAAGIGGSNVKSCGNITITTGVTSVTATAGQNAPYSIGAGYLGTCGTVTIGATVTGSIKETPFTYEPGVTQIYGITYNLDGGTNVSSNPFYYFSDASFTLADPSRFHYDFIGWTWEGQTEPVKSATIPSGTTGNLTMTAHWTYGNVVQLGLAPNEYTLLNNEILTGTGGELTHITIADGATVTLSDVNITSIKTNSRCRWAGITCEGDATIILEGENFVNGGYLSSGIYVSENKTLTIRGDGSLTATGASGAAGIGGGEDLSCGNIIITGGTITATGGVNAAGLGSGYDASCGNITISGGNITATGGEYGAGLGCGYKASCGNITINGGIVSATGDKYSAGIGGGNSASGITRTCGHITISRTVTSVTATAGQNAPYSIGPSSYCTCEAVTIGGTFGAISDSPYTYVPSGSMTSTVHFDANGGTGAMDDWLFTCDGTWQSIPACAITAPDGYLFIGWNTSTDGSGAFYKDEQQIVDIPDVTLFAQWVQTVCEITTQTEALKVYNGQTLTGTGGKNPRITIADGATVTLKNVNITAIPNNDNHKWTGINCEGDATIILSGNNAVTGGYNYPGIYVPVNYTLIIRGDGSLNVTGRNNSAGIGSSYFFSCGNIIIEDGNITAKGGQYAAGIGSSYKTSCGNITITGGTIIATGGNSSAGIGSGKEGSCGNITISGGTITATGKDSSAGIGCGYCGSCEDITITNGVTRVVATKASSNSAIDIIGKGKGTSSAPSTVGTITISPNLLDVTNDNTRTLWGLALADNSDNTEAIGVKDGQTTDVLLRDRTLYKDGTWNTIVLPFDVALEGSPLDGATAKPLTDATMTSAKVSLTFGDAVTTLQAGKPYIIRWARADDYVDDNAHNIVSPMFTGVTVNAASNNTWNADHSVGFVGNFDAIKGTWADSSLLLGSDNTLHFAANDETLGALRAFVQIDNTKVESMPAAYAIDFGNGETAKGVFRVIPGDANKDGQVTITDAVAIVNYILGNPSADFNPEAANVNGDTDDGKPNITITDAVAVVNIILNSGGSSAPQLDMTEPEPMVEAE